MKAGEIIAGRYELREQIGNGRCSLYIAQDRQANRPVTVRIFDTAHVTPEALQRYANVLAASASLEHPAVVLPRIQVATFETPPFVVGEVLAGESLGSVCGRLKTIPWERAVAITLACLEGLVALERVTGLAHRALRPGNVWLGPKGRTQILDFGIAELGAFPMTPRSDGSHVEYRAPEQLEGSAGDARSDIFTMGVMLFEMLTGVHPFTGPNPAAVRIKIQMHAAPRPSQVAQRIQIPAALDVQVGQMLARRAKDRPADHATLIRELSRLLPSPAEASEQPSVAVPPETQPSLTAPHTSVLPPPPVADSRPKVAVHSAPLVEPLRSPRIERPHIPAARPETADTTLILPEEHTERDRPVELTERTVILPTKSEDEVIPAPSRSLDRTLALPSNNRQDPEDQITLTRTNPRRQVIDRTEVVSRSKGRIPALSNERISSPDQTEAVLRNPAGSRVSVDVTEIHVSKKRRPTPAIDTPGGHQAALEDEITTFRPRPTLDRPRHVPTDLAVTGDEAAAPQSPDSQEPPAAGGQVTHGDANPTGLAVPRLIVINILLLILLLGFWVFTR